MDLLCTEVDMKNRLNNCFHGRGSSIVFAKLHFIWKLGIGYDN